MIRTQVLVGSLLALGAAGVLVGDTYLALNWFPARFPFLFAFLFPITSAAIINYLERKIMAWMQDRQGPLHTGPQGSLQLVADVGKMLLKEDVHPASSDKLVFLLAPSAFIAPMVASFAVLPFSPFLGLPGTALATGIVYLVALSSMDVIGVIMAGWGSNNKYSMIGAMRSVAQII